MSEEKPTPEQIAQYLRSQGLMVVPQQQAVQVGAPAPMAPMGPSAPMGRRAGGGGATFTGVTAGTYAFGTGSVTVNSKGQVLNIASGGSTTAAAGDPTEVQFNTGGFLDADPAFTFDKATGQLRVTSIRDVSDVTSGTSAATNFNILDGATGKVTLETIGVVPVDYSVKFPSAAATVDDSVVTIDINGNVQFVSPLVAVGPVFAAYSLTTRGLGSPGIFYMAGFYQAPADDANLDQASGPATIGGADGAFGAHAFLVGGGAGTASGGAGAVEIEVSGTSITDGGLRDASATEVIIADVTTMTLNGYAETTKKWIGTVTYTIKNASGSTQTTFSADFNYGFAQYDDMGNRDFEVTDFLVTGFAGANDVGFNIQLFHHSPTGWTYSAAAFVPGGTIIADMVTDYVTETDLVNNEPFGYKRDNLSTAVNGNNGQGIVVAITTASTNSVEYANARVSFT